MTALARVRAFLDFIGDDSEDWIAGPEGENLFASDLRAVLAMVPAPLDAQTTKYLALHTLRSAGWTCTPPSDPAAPIPAPAVGQVWRSGKRGGPTRQVIELFEKWGHPAVRYATRNGEVAWLRLTAFRAWAARSGARPDEVTP